jgi:hypothetical protein
MPWLALDYKEREKKEDLADKFSVSGIPKFILLDGDSGDIICSDGRDQLQNKDKKGEKFPWKKVEEKVEEKEKEKEDKDEEE